MTIRETSREAYRHLIETGQLKGRQAAALDAVIKYGPATSGEIIAKGMLGDNTNLWRSRFVDLQARGLIREVGQRPCRISGRMCLLWEATGRSKPLDVKKGHRANGKLERVEKILREHSTLLAIEGAESIHELAERIVEAL